jgi:hypothetical protein
MAYSKAKAETQWQSQLQSINIGTDIMKCRIWKSCLMAGQNTSSAAANT